VRVRGWRLLRRRKHHGRIAINGREAEVVLKHCTHTLRLVACWPASLTSCILRPGSGDWRLRRLLVRVARVAEHVAAAGGTALLPLEPAAETVEVEDMSARELFRRLVRPVVRWLALVGTRGAARNHLLAADDAGRVAELRELLGCRVRVQLVHIARGASIPHQVGAAGDKAAQGHVHVADNVHREAVVEEDDDEEDEVREQLCKVWGSA